MSFFSRFLKRGNKAPVTPVPKRGGGLLGKTAGGIGTGAGLYGLGSLFGGSNRNESGANLSDEGGFGTSAGMGADGSGSSNYTPAAAATSVLSDADSSDPVVRQLQDIERVLVSIKGDTATLSTGLNKLTAAGKNKSAMAGMFGQSKTPESNLKSFLPLLIASLVGLGFFGKDEEDGDKDNDGVPDDYQNPKEVATRKNMDEKSVRFAGQATRTAENVAKMNEAILATAPEKPDVTDADDLSKKGGVDTDTGQATSKTPETPDVDAKTETPDVDADPKSLKGKIAKAIGRFAMKSVPIAGDAETLLAVGDKLSEGDFKGAAMEASSLATTYGSGILAGAAATTGVGALASPSIMALGNAAALGIDYNIVTRDVYKDVHGVFPEDDTDPRRDEKEKEIRNEVVKYIQNLPKNLFSKGTANVEARPEVTIPESDNFTTNQERLEQQKKQKSWDEKYGEKYNPDGSMKREFLEAGEARGAGFFQRMLGNADETTGSAAGVVAAAGEGASRLAPGLKVLEEDAADGATPTPTPAAAAVVATPVTSSGGSFEDIDPNMPFIELDDGSYVNITSKKQLQDLEKSGQISKQSVDEIDDVYEELDLQGGDPIAHQNQLTAEIEQGYEEGLRGETAPAKATPEPSSNNFLSGIRKNSDQRRKGRDSQTAAIKEMAERMGIPTDGVRGTVTVPGGVGGTPVVTSVNGQSTSEFLTPVEQQLLQEQADRNAATESAVENALTSGKYVPAKSLSSVESSNLMMDSNTLESDTDLAQQTEKEDQARRISGGVGESVAMNQKVQSTGVIPNTPSVNVSVAGTKTSFPQGLAELKFINDRGSYLT